MTTKEDIQKVLWNAAGSFRGKIDSGKYKDYILSMLFVKYLSDAIKETKEELIKNIMVMKKEFKELYKEEDSLFLMKQHLITYMIIKRQQILEVKLILL